MWVNISDKEIEAAVKALQGPCPAIAERILAEQKQLTDLTRCQFVNHAEEKYGEEGDDREINIDEDAVVCESDDHSFVMAWVYVTKSEIGLTSEEDEDDDEDDEDEG